jgi:methyl-accepting chemotaxis protein
METAMPTDINKAQDARLANIAGGVIPIWRQQIEQCLHASSLTVADLLVSFFAVADELIMAIGRSAHLNKDLSSQLDGILKEINELRAKTVAVGKDTALSHKVLHESVGRAFQSLLALTSAYQELGDINLNVRDNVDQILVALQNEDRMSQILTHVCEDMRRLEVSLEKGPAALPDLKAWMDTLRATYTTPEEHAVHTGESEPAPAAGIDFF